MNILCCEFSRSNSMFTDFILVRDMCVTVDNCKHKSLSVIIFGEKISVHIFV
jgi:hypothetical protein